MAAKVQVQVIVDRKQVDELSAALDKINGKKLNVSTRQVTDNIKEVEKAERELIKTREEEAKLNEILSRTEKNRAAAQASLARAEKERAGAEKADLQVQKEKHRVAESALKSDTAKINKTRALERQQREATKAQEQATKATEEGSEAVKKQGLLYDILGRSVSSFIVRMTAYRAVYAGIRAITNGFSEALETLKAVDDELVTVRKVTGFDAAQMANVEEQAYAVASKYGANASDYVSGVAAYARAGYKDLSGDLAELAQKTIIVGDTTADIANQFLLSVDAAYKFNGSVRELSKVLDAANELDNRYATSIEKIAEGMGIVAPVAEQMHVGVYELEAAIGTITAVTQRSGTEAARALRAIMLNIVGDTTNEIEEGVTWTTGEIAGLRDVIKQYAPEAYKAAQATGEIIDPMKAIGGLAQSFKEGLLTEQKLMEMVSDIGGKLRTSQLLALIQNWDMYNSMLEDTKNAVGSADKEIENAMDSWTRKSEVLKNTWTEFVKTGPNSEFFKWALDTLTAFVERLGTLGGVLIRLIPLVAALSLRETAKNFTEFAKSGTLVAKAFNAIGASAKGLNIAAAAVGALGLAWSVASYLIEDAKIKHEEETKRIYEEGEAAKESANNLIALTGEMNAASYGTDEFRKSAKNLADTLGTDIPDAAEAAVQKIRELTAEEMKARAASLYESKSRAESEFLSAVRGANSSYHLLDAIAGEVYGDESDAYLRLVKRVQEISAGVRSANGENGLGIINISDIEQAKRYREAAGEIVAEMQRYAERQQDNTILNEYYYKDLQTFLNDTAEGYEKVNSTVSEYLRVKGAQQVAEDVARRSINSKAEFNAYIGSITKSKEYSSEFKDILIALAYEYFPQYKNAAEEAAEANEKVAKAANDAADAEDRLKAAKERATAAAKALIPVLFDEAGKLTEEGQAALSASSYLADLIQTEIDLQNQTDKANYATMRAQLAALASDAVKAARAIMAAYAVSESLVSLKRYAIENGATPDVMRALTLLSALDGLDKKISATTVSASYVAPYTSTYKPSTGSSGGSSGGSSSSSSSSSAKTEDTTLTALKNSVTLLKSELSLMQARGDSEEAQISKMRQIQEALKKEYQYLESIQGDQATINGLYEEWYNYANKISDIQEKTAEDAEKQATAYQEALDAQIALQNLLKNNRSVRYYNAATGRWEWQANPSDVASAQEAASKALSGLSVGDQRSVLKSAMLQTGGMASSISDFLSRISSGGVNSTNNYGNTYNLGGLSISEALAKSMSVYDLAQLSQTLVVHA